MEESWRVLTEQSLVPDTLVQIISLTDPGCLLNVMSQTRPISSDKSGSTLRETPIPEESITESAPILPFQSITDMVESAVVTVIGRVV